jgi:hypothetical protein
MLWNKCLHPIILLFIGILFTGCCARKHTQVVNQDSGVEIQEPILPDGTTALTPPALVYKTRRDYNDRVPVIMNAEKDKIISYPAPTDLFYEGKLALPIRLKNGYLLDNRGIGERVAFLTYTYSTYCALKQAPDMKQLRDSLLDINPLTELWQCGSRSTYKNVEQELNALIDQGFPNCKALMVQKALLPNSNQP